ncbi:MAG: 16S rRNA (cytosine(1402)-N(4))-methyltransferase RsmH [Bacteroidales bacterium]|nr:16S rRNA (cytosine(1402)-N(4))-methyltransferase RsmH [Bacteroidales bacterium]
MEYHEPVMLNESVDALCIRPDGTYVDVTFGGGGHSRAILAQLGDSGRLLAFDQDKDAAANAINDPRFTLIGENFQHLKNYLRLYGVRRVDGLLADLGISSHQVDDAQRGFSFRADGPLDLRMDQRGSTTAAALVNTLGESELARLLRLYGELPNAAAIAHSICLARKEQNIETTWQLKNAVARQLPRGAENKHLAMLFQALRLEVNGEMEALRQMLAQAVELLDEGGRLAIISYHSLEDRLVKNVMKTGNPEGELKKDFFGNPLVPLKQIVRKPLTPSPEEVGRNPRSRSAKLRVAEKLEQKNKSI